MRMRVGREGKRGVLVLRWWAVCKMLVRKLSSGLKRLLLLRWLLLLMQRNRILQSHLSGNQTLDNGDCARQLLCGRRDKFQIQGSIRAARGGGGGDIVGRHVATAHRHHGASLLKYLGGRKHTRPKVHECVRISTRRKILKTQKFSVAVAIRTLSCVARSVSAERSTHWLMSISRKGYSTGGAVAAAAAAAVRAAA